MDDGLFDYIQACIFSRLKLLFNSYVKRTVRRQDFGAKFNLTFHNGAPVADILKQRLHYDIQGWIGYTGAHVPMFVHKLGLIKPRQT